MPMPYNVVKNAGNYQIQTLYQGKWVNGKDMNFTTSGEAWQKAIELIENDYIKRVPEELRKQIAIETRKFTIPNEGKK